ncbi:MAG: glycosyltransferase family 2 protein [Candidatus Krumholzibacteriota bacterium]|nr:glycosyltransferase family 2 protein [Candidatus Krumholzibacteriota bacterium]
MKDLRVLVTTFDEEANLPGCLASVDFAGEIWVVDSYSRDRTPTIARVAGARLLQREYRSPADQKNWALDAMGPGWVLILDADERVSPALREELARVLAAPAREAYWVPRRTWFLGRQIRHCGWQRDGVVRLLRQEAGRYDPALVHEQMRCRGPVGRLRSPIEHHSYRSLEDYLERMRRYARQGGLQRFRRGQRAGAANVLLRPAARFLRMYLYQQGYRDGAHGFLLCVLSSLQVGLKHAIHWAYAHGILEDAGEPRD